MKQTGSPKQCNHYTTDTRPYSAGLPIFKFINAISIVDVAKKIGLECSDDTVVCWRASEHRRGTSRFLRVLESNKVVCEACDTYPMSVLD